MAALAIPAVALFAFVSALVNAAADGQILTWGFLAAGYAVAAAALTSTLPAASASVFDDLAAKHDVRFINDSGADDCSVVAANAVTWRAALLYLGVTMALGASVLPQAGLPAAAAFAVASGAASAAVVYGKALLVSTI